MGNQSHMGSPRLHLVTVQARELRDEAVVRYEHERRVAKGIWQMCLVLGAIIALGWWLS